MSDSASSYTAQKQRKATQIKEESRKHLEACNVQEGEPVMARKPAPAVLQVTRDSIRTNIYSVRFDKTTQVYRYDLTITGKIEGEAREYDYTRRAGSEVQIVDRKEKCRAAFEFLIGSRPDIIQSRENCVYDLQAILFTFVKINISGDRLDVEIPLTAAENDLRDARNRPMFGNSTSLKFTIKVVRNFHLILDNNTVAQSVNSNLEEQSSDLQQFVEILTSQYTFAQGNQHVTFQGGRSYLLNPQAHGFDQRDSPDLGRGAYLAIGAQKACKVVEGPPPGDSPRLTVVVENKKTPFHLPTPVIEKIISAFPRFQENPQRDIQQILRLLKDLWVMTTYDDQPDFKVYSLESSAQQQMFEIDGRQINVVNYFAERFQIRLEHPDWPLIVARKSDGRRNYYPIELCVICDNQRLTSTQLTPDQTSTIIRSCAQPPRQQVEHITRNVEALKMNAEGCMQAAGVVVLNDPIQVQGKNVSHPQIQFQGAISQLDPQRGEWKPSPHARFLIPAQVETWAIYVHAPRRMFNDQMFGQFVQTFLRRCHEQGMQIGDPIENIYVDSLEHLRARFDAARSAGGPCNLFVVITDRKDLEVHQQLKAYEQEFDIVTQNVTTKIALDSVNPQGGGRLTLSNVVNKTNMKCGGVNYAVYPTGYKFPLGEDDLFIGFGSNHPGGYASDEERKIGGAPTVIGYSANDLEHPCAFSGDYVYAESRRDEKVGVIDQIVKLCIERYQRNRKKAPKRVFVFRNGCSEGQYPGVLRFEVPLILKAFKDTGITAGLTLIVPNRMHNVRLTPAHPQGQKAWEQNLPCGTAIDSIITHPKFFDYYLLSHIARQGTAKVPRYTVLYDSNNLKSEEAMIISYCLCFEHQIINGPTSFPTPVYIANRYAERGRMVYNVFQRTALDQQIQLPTYEEYNQRLTYLDRTARNVRFNA